MGQMEDVVKEIHDKGRDLTDWEMRFIGDMLDRVKKYTTLRLSPKQSDIITRIHQERVTGNPGAQEDIQRGIADSQAQEVF